MKKNLGKNLAAAAALAFLTVAAAPVFAADTDVKCFGVNSCKGQGACKSAANACKGQNSCKGKGFEMESAADCTAANGSLTDPAAPAAQ